ncbi:GntR family transcriptional regulator/MocR family aminotransferase [Agrobacterium tumefaciens]|jgi:GntR family transcriptional regulator/MocR family aminotransferase|uniref:GntR family transcriptional regulator/MocR family aminotransferase n=1 Tax=Agrobacterium radiobacter TaxID=362 RepID=A0ABR6JE50_AGRRD|nr:MULTISPECIES: PLP-dependent aminotransferase family protein [Agrobacterium tumefaciens complex]MBB4321190.1 GntR family transcriptional regulator/MocR family aminotransferase [Agrobacterium radiobacter]MBB4338230.1 GntR family transcriptional regulator/MocR family aminotransferase [Agrobacterium radiobacter]MBB4493118.1 GntR family transcriptional regulator/MocR family aminotransferase [Agrobacterium radiobacter]MBB4498391.1 GntR family transcriptional regulator/MocR family aminotransferase 
MPTTSKSTKVGIECLQFDPLIRNQAQRVHGAFRVAILEGLLPPGTLLPSSRALSQQIGVGRNTIVVAYEHLLSDGLVEARHGSGTFVAPVLPPPPHKARPWETQAAPVPKRPFGLGQPLVQPELLARLANAARRRIAEAAPLDLGYGDPRGSLHLRRQIAASLAVDRGLRCDPDCIVVVSGTQHGLRLCADALLALGDKVWMEDPGYGVARATLVAGGADTVPVSVDGEGLDIADGRRRAPMARAAYVTPSHQFPTGVTMSMRRRVELLEWAEDAGAWILEDDYDSEFRYAGPPLTALAGLSSTRVIYLGTFAKTLFPALRIGYVVLPPAAVGRVLSARAAIDRFPPAFMQDAIADLMADGTVSAHLRRMRKLYREARNLLASTINEESGGVLTAILPEQGLHMVVRLPPGLGRQAGLAIRERAGVDTMLLSDTRSAVAGPDAFILGFSGFVPAELSRAAQSLARTAAEYVSENAAMTLV